MCRIFSKLVRLVFRAPANTPGPGAAWRGVDFKLAEARFFLSEMGKDLESPVTRYPQLAAIAATGANVAHPWQERFYYHLDAFLAAARSVPEIIQYQGGRC